MRPVHKIKKFSKKKECGGKNGNIYESSKIFKQNIKIASPLVIPKLYNCRGVC